MKAISGRAAAVALVTALVLILSLPGPAPAGSSTYIHFIVVPVETKGGVMLDRALADFKTWLARQAGGYTHLGRTDGGSVRTGGAIATSQNHSFIVSAKWDLTALIEEYVPKHFDTDKPFVLVWQGTTNF